MANNNDFRVLLQAVLDSSNIGQSDIKEVQKVLNKYHLNLTADLNKAELLKTVKAIVPQLEAELKKITGVDIKISDNAILKSINQIGKEADVVANKINEIQRSLDSEKYSTQVNTINMQLSKFGTISGEVFRDAKAFANELTVAYEKMKSAMSDDTIDNSVKIKAEEEYQKALAKTQNLLKQLNSDKDNELVSIGDPKRINLINTLNSFLEKNTAINKDNKKIIQEWVSTLSASDDMTVGAIKNINTEFKSLKVTLSQNKQLGLSWIDKLKKLWSKLGGFSLSATAFIAVTNKIRQMPQEVYKLDTAMTDLYKVTDETDIRYNKFLTSACENAEKLGRSISSLVEQTANWSKLGYSLDEAEQLAQISSIYANVGEVDDDTAVSDLVTAMKAFNIEASNAITIVDKLNTLGNKYATSAADLGEGLSRSASAMATAGTDIDKTLAMLTGGAEITQSAAEFGNMLKIGSMRIRGMKGELEALGEEVDDNVESISKMQTQILNLTHGNVNIFDNNGEFKDYYDIMEDIAKIYNDLSSTEQASLIEILFGKQRGNQGAALIQAFQSGQIQKAYEDIQNSAGSAYEEQAKWMDSLEAKTAKFEAAFQSLSNTVLDSDLLKMFVDLGTGAVKALDNIFKHISPLKTGIAGLIAFLNKGRSKQRFCPLWG